MTPQLSPIKLRGALIMRLPDLRRYFEPVRFMEQAPAFLAYLRAWSLPRFTDTPQEKHLLMCVRSWLETGRVEGASILADRFNAGASLSVPLGPLEEAVEAARSEGMPRHDLLGLTALFLLVGPAAPGEPGYSALREDYLRLLPRAADGPTPQAPQAPGLSLLNTFIPVTTSTLSLTPAAEGPGMTLRCLANTESQTPVTITLGEEDGGSAAAVTLEPGECVSGLFRGSGCVRLLPRRHALPSGSLLMEQCVDYAAMAPMLRITRGNEVEEITGAVCGWVEPDGTPAWVTAAGEVKHDPAAFSLASRLKNFRRHNPAARILAIEYLPDQQEYTIFTPDFINR